MAENIFTRAARLVNAGIESALDKAEAASGTALMRDAVRRVDDAIERLEDEKHGLAATAMADARHREQMQSRAEEWRAKAEYALEKDREDLAKDALAAQIDCEQHAAQCDSDAAAFAQRSAAIDTQLAELAERRSALETQLREVEQAKAAATPKTTATQSRTDDRVKRQVAEAEATFKRSMDLLDRKAASVAATDAKLDAMKLDDEIAERIAQMKAGQ